MLNHCIATRHGMMIENGNGRDASIEGKKPKMLIIIISSSSVDGVLNENT